MCSMRARRFEGAETRQPDDLGQQSRRLQQQPRRFCAQAGVSWALAKILKDLEEAVVSWTLHSIMCSMRARRFEGARTRQPDDLGQQSRRLQQQPRRFCAQVERNWALAKLLKDPEEAGMLRYLWDHVVKVSPGAALRCSSMATNTTSKGLFPFLFPIANHIAEVPFTLFLQVP